MRSLDEVESRESSLRPITECLPIWPLRLQVMHYIPKSIILLPSDSSCVSKPFQKHWQKEVHQRKQGNSHRAAWNCKWIFMNTSDQHLTSPPNTKPEFSTAKNTANQYDLCSLIIGMVINDSDLSKSKMYIPKGSRRSLSNRRSSVSEGCLHNVENISFFPLNFPIHLFINIHCSTVLTLWLLET